MCGVLAFSCCTPRLSMIVSRNLSALMDAEHSPSVSSVIKDSADSLWITLDNVVLFILVGFLRFAVCAIWEQAIGNIHSLRSTDHLQIY